MKTARLGKIKIVFWIAALSSALGHEIGGREYAKRTPEPAEIRNFLLKTSSVARELQSMGFHAEIPKELQNPETMPLDPKKAIIIRDENNVPFTEESLEKFLKRNNGVSLEQVFQRIEILLAGYEEIKPKIIIHQQEIARRRELGQKRGFFAGAGTSLAAIAGAWALRKRKELQRKRRH